MIRTVLTSTTAVAVALTTLMVAGQSVVGLDDCYSRLDVEARIPGCCGNDDVPTIEETHRSCCRTPFISDQGPSSTTVSTPDVAEAGLAVVVAPIGGLLSPATSGAHGFRSIIERPLDRSPPTIHTVFLI